MKILISILILYYSLPLYSETIKDKISFKTADNWNLLYENIEDSTFSAGYEIPVGSRESFNKANVLFRACYVPDKVEASHIDVFSFANTVEARLLLSEIDDKNWKTSLLVKNDYGEQVIFLHRVGVIDNIAFEFIYMFTNSISQTENKNNLKVLTFKSYQEDKSNKMGVVCCKEDILPYIDLFKSICKEMKINNIGGSSKIIEFTNIEKDMRFFRDDTPIK